MSERHELWLQEAMLDMRKKLEKSNQRIKVLEDDNEEVSVNRLNERVRVVEHQMNDLMNMRIAENHLKNMAEICEATARMIKLLEKDNG